MGVESTQEIAQLVGMDLINELVPSLERIHRNTVNYPGISEALPVVTTKLARLYIANMLRKLPSNNKRIILL